LRVVSSLPQIEELQDFFLQLARVSLPLQKVSFLRTRLAHSAYNIWMKHLRRHIAVIHGYWKFVLLLALASFGLGYWLHLSDIKNNATEIVETSTPKKLEQLYPYLIPPGSTLSDELKNLGVDDKTISQLVDAAKPVINLGRLRAGTRFQLTHLTDPSSEVVGIDFQLTPIQSVHMQKSDGTWHAETVTETVQSKVVMFTGTVRSSLWESAESAGMDTELIIQLAEIFGWQVDFAREVRVNDRWRLTVEQKFVNEKPVGWGSILGAEYQNDKKIYNAILFKLSDGVEGYFAEDGSSLRRAFLKSPLRYGRITSRYSTHRFHPILKFTRPHLGVDYGAPVGTPVRAVGDGVVTFVGTQGGSGKTLKISHGAKYQTVYRHLNGYERGIKIGAHVKQGQSVAYVGKTGLATGPHLHFEFWVNDKVIDPLKLSAPAADPVPVAKMVEFRAHAEKVLKELPPWNVSR
jgi:murein DD-endopeptidase MepM/ murein hydrolase activator NlpD